VAAEANAADVCSDRLPQPGEPSLGVLPRIVVSVKLVRAERAVQVSQGQLARAEPGREARAGGEREVAVVAVRLKSAREIAREGQLLRESAGAEGERAALLVDAEIAGGGAQAEFGRLGRLRNDVDRSPDRVGTVQVEPDPRSTSMRATGRAAANVQVVVTRLRVVEPLPIEQDEGLAKLDPRIRRSDCMPSGARRRRSSEGSSCNRSVGC
jgi:hypothetical protein